MTEEKINVLDQTADVLASVAPRPAAVETADAKSGSAPRPASKPASAVPAAKMATKPTNKKIEFTNPPFEKFQRLPLFKNTKNDTFNAEESGN